MKKLVSMALAMSMCLACLNSAMAAPVHENPTLNEDGCGSVAVACTKSDSSEAQNGIIYDDMTAPEPADAADIIEDETNCSVELVEKSAPNFMFLPQNSDVSAQSLTRSTSKPKTFWNIASDGIYHGSFSGVGGTIYTNYYFDWDKDNHRYYARVNATTHLYKDVKTFVVKNYCMNCGLVATSEEFSTGYDGASSGNIAVRLSFTKKHDGHFMYPAVTCTSSSGKIDGTIDVNYTNSWF